ncbi:MAG: metal-dependent transcriptional regulator [Cytophagales bacterium]|tara:strand:- start:96 stop:764 length:669 start_codon:yes stop_codon:yes gene_type:complete
MTNLILSKSEENYLKSIYNLSELGNKVVTTNSISKILNIEPASVTDMIKKLSKKKLIYHEKYRGTKISKNGIKVALQIIRRHRLWEVFLYEKLNFNWDEIHEVAEELEHVSSDQLIDNLDKYLKYPKIDPHGDPIPNKLGEIDFVDKISISDLKINEKGIVSRIINEDEEFFILLNKLNIEIGTEVKILDKIDYDGSLDVSINNKSIIISKVIAENIKITKI